MIQIGIPELLILILVIFFAFKPEDIQKNIKQFLKIFFDTKKFVVDTKDDLKQQLKIDELKQDLHNEEKMKEFERDKNV
jgi:Sec-independent protein translocase protein TatA